MSINDFLTKQNIDMLWEVLLDNNIQSEVLREVNTFFITNIKGFFDAEKNNCSNLVTMNKKFITVIMGYINKTSNQRQISIPQKKEIITTEDIQSDRLTKFEKELNAKQNEFTRAMTLQVPPVPKFSDNNLDEPISEMETAIKKAVEQRNYDILQVTQTLNKSNADSWLKSQETSVKTEKNAPIQPKPKNTQTQNQPQQNQTQPQKQLNYIKINDDIENNILNKDIIDLTNNNNSPRKHISWSDTNSIINNDTNEHNIKLEISEDDSLLENSIFKKLKKINSPPVDPSEKIKILETKVDYLIDKIDIIFKMLKS